jgi:isoleucyl-tRNA synthetase
MRKQFDTCQKFMPTITPTLADIKYQKLQAQTEREVFMNSVLKASYVRMDDAQITWGAATTVIKNYLLSIPAMIAPLIIGKEDKDEVIKIMREVIWNALNDVDKLEAEIILLRNKRMTKYQQKLKENDQTRINTTRVKVP